MIRRVIREYSRVPISTLPVAALRRLRNFDHACGRLTGQTVFDWSRANSLRAQSLVGVLQVQGLTIEILPKIANGEVKDGSVDPPVRGSKQLGRSRLGEENAGNVVGRSP